MAVIDVLRVPIGQRKGSDADDTTEKPCTEGWLRVVPCPAGWRCNGRTIPRPTVNRHCVFRTTAELQERWKIYNLDLQGIPRLPRSPSRVQLRYSSGCAPVEA